MLPRSARSMVLGPLALVSAVAAQDWPHWRGPNHNGSTAAKSLAADFSQEKNVRWALDLPGPAACTPIVLGERIFLSSVDSARQRLVALCVRREDGKLLWKKDAGSGYRPGGAGSPIARSRRSNYASPSPTTDGERVVFFFGNGDLVAYDLEGVELWRRNIQQDYGDFAFQWTFSASPTIWEGRVFLPVLQRDTPVAMQRRGMRRGLGRRRRGGALEPASLQERAAQERAPVESFLLAMDPASGKTLYKHLRPSPARVESRESYATPIPYVGEDGRKELLVVGGDVLTGHDPATGKELWRWGTWNPGHRQAWWRLVPTAVVGGGVALVCAPKRAPAFAIRLGGSGRLGEEDLVWQSEGRPNFVSSDVPTPAFHAGHFYVLNDDRAALSKVDPKSGGIRWTTALPRDTKWRASPTAADGKIWCINHGGLVVVVDAENGDILHRARMGEEDDDLIRASIVVAHGCLFIRTNTKLFCIGR